MICEGCQLDKTVVCEAEGADWLPFWPFFAQQSCNGKRSREAIWTRDDSEPRQLRLDLERAA